MFDLKEHIAKTFPCTEEFVDCCGVARTFTLSVRTLPYSFVVEAREVTGSWCGYCFEVVSEGDPFTGLGRLRAKIRKALSQRYLTTDRGEVSLTHDTLAGWISNDGLVIDGAFLPWDELKRLLTIHEGFPIRIQLSDTSERE